MQASPNCITKLKILKDFSGIFNLPFCKQEKFTKVISRLSPKKPQKRSFHIWSYGFLIFWSCGRSFVFFSIYSVLWIWSPILACKFEVSRSFLLKMFTFCNKIIQAMIKPL